MVSVFHSHSLSSFLCPCLSLASQEKEGVQWEAKEEEEDYEEEGEEADRPASTPVSPQLCVRPRLRRPAVSMPLPYTHAQICGHT